MYYLDASKRAYDFRLMPFIVMRLGRAVETREFTNGSSFETHPLASFFYKKTIKRVSAVLPMKPGLMTSAHPQTWIERTRVRVRHSLYLTYHFIFRQNGLLLLTFTSAFQKDFQNNHQ